MTPVQGLRLSLWSFTAVLLLLFALVLTLLFSQRAARLGVETVVGMVDGLQVADVSGRLVGPLEMRGIRYAANGLQIEVADAALEWVPRNLWSRELRVSRLTFTGVNALLPDAPAGDQPFEGFILPESLPLPVSVFLREFAVEDLTIETSGGQLALDNLAVSIALDLLPGSSANSARVSWTNLVVRAKSGDTLQDAPLAKSPRGEWRVKGALDDYRLQGELLARDPAGREGTFRLRGNGDRRSLTGDEVVLLALKGEARGTARVDWSQGVAAQALLEGRGFDPAQWDPRLPGEVNFVVDAAMANQELRLDRLTLFGEWQRQPVNIDARLSQSGDTLRIETLSGHIGGTQFKAGGTIAQTLELLWQVDSPDLSALLPQLRGRLQSEGRLRGELAAPVLTGTFALESAGYGEYAVARVTAAVDLDLATRDSGRSSAIVKGQGLQLGDIQVTAVKAQLDGSLGEHTLTVDADSEQGKLSAALQGAWDGSAWSGVLRSGVVEPVSMPAWTLDSPQALTISQESQLLADDGCWRSGEARLCISMDRSATGMLVDLLLKELPADLLSSGLPEDLRVSGRLGGNASVMLGADSAVSIDARLTSSALLLERVSAQEGDLVQSLALEPGSLSVTGTMQSLAATLELPFSAGGGLTGDVTVQGDGTLADAALDGSFQASVPDLSFLGAMSPEIERIAGSATLDVTLAGSAAAPRPLGELQVEVAELALVRPGLLLEELNLVATGDVSGNISVRGQARSDEGTLRWQGSALLREVESAVTTGPPLSDITLQITGEQFLFWNSAEASIWGSPDVVLSVVDDALHLRGSVIVPRASITPTQLPPSAVRTTPDQVIVDPDGASDTAQARPAGSVDLHAAVKLVLGDDVQITGFGFKGNLQGDLNIRHTPGRPILASGELNVINGEYRAFGQGLVIERGQLLFAGGDIENPGLNIRAQRRPAADIIVGVNVTGQVQKPDLRIFSEPAMSSSNQLSWLVLGRPFENTSGAETDYISQAALILGIQGGDYLASGVGEKLGLDTIGIETGTGEAGAESDVNQAALVVGKYLTPRLYISYGVGLLESISTVKLRYRISDRWNFVTESSPIASGGDINYTIER